MNRFRFVHLNVHSHYSINDGCASIKELVDAAIKDRMPGIAITDNGNMFGVMEFFDYVSRINNERRQKGEKQNRYMENRFLKIFFIFLLYIYAYRNNKINYIRKCHLSQKNRLIKGLIA